MQTCTGIQPASPLEALSVVHRKGTLCGPRVNLLYDSQCHLIGIRTVNVAANVIAALPFGCRNIPLQLLQIQQQQWKQVQ